MVIKDSQLKQWLMPVLKLLVAILLISWLIRSGRFDLLALKKINTPFVWMVGVLIFCAVLISNSLRWMILLRAENVRISFFESLRLSLIGTFFNFFTPGGIGGDVVKAGYLMRSYREKKWFIGWSILVDRILGMLALLLYSAITGLFFYKQLQPDLQTSFYTLSLFILLGFVVLVSILIFSPKQKIAELLRNQPFLEKVFIPLFYFFQKPQNVVLPFVFSLISQGLVISLGIFLVHHLQLELPIWMVLLIFPFGFLATVLPISPAGIGVGQAAFYYLFKRIANNGEFGVLTITFFQAVQFLVGLIGGLLFVLYKKKEED